MVHGNRGVMPFLVRIHRSSGFHFIRDAQYRFSSRKSKTLVLLVACQDLGNTLNMHPLSSELVHTHAECPEGDQQVLGLGYGLCYLVRRDLNVPSG